MLTCRPCAPAAATNLGSSHLLAHMTSVLDELQDRFATLLGPDRVSTSPTELARHGRGESYHPVAAPDVVVWPQTSGEVATIVDGCRALGVPLIPFGAGTSLEGHVNAIGGGVCIDLSRMTKILRVSLADVDATVEAGVTRIQLERRLGPEGVFFPVDPGADATIGGMVATGASGTTTVRYGSMRENVISLTVVTAGGEIVRTHSRARKSSAGYDLTRLFIGSEGTLGIITEIVLRLHPIPDAIAAPSVPFLPLSAPSIVPSGRSRSGSRPPGSNSSMNSQSRRSTGATTSHSRFCQQSSSSSTAAVTRWPNNPRPSTASQPNLDVAMSATRCKRICGAAFGRREAMPTKPCSRFVRARSA
jgi:hypothetical protein